MKISFFPRHTAALIGLLLISAFTTAQAVNDNCLGTWSLKIPGLSSNENYDIYGMAYGNNTYVIVGQSASANKAFTANSTDGKTWTIRSTGSTSSRFHSVIFSKGRFIAVCKQPEGTAAGNARIWTSDDNGNTWRTRDSDDLGLIVGGGLHAVTSDGKGNLVAVGGAQVGGGWITVSTNNGTAWHIVRSTPTTFHNYPYSFYGVGYALGSWYAFTTSSTYGSSDMDTWNNIGGPGVDDMGYKVASNETTIVVASSLGPKWTNDGGETWHSGIQAKGFEALGSLGGAISSVVYADGYFVLAVRTPTYDNVTSKYYADIWISETGREWKRWKSAGSTHPNAYTLSLCYAKKAFWCGGWFEKLSKSPPWFKARNGCSSDYPYTLFDSEDGPPNRIGLPQYRVNTASLNLVLESTLFYTNTQCSPLNFKLVYNSKPTADGDTSIGPFGKNWRFRYESAVGRFGQVAQVIAGGGRSHTFTSPHAIELADEVAGLTLKNPDGIFDTLNYITNGVTSSFELTLKSSHLTYVYGTPGTGTNNTGLYYLSAIKDQFGNTTTFTIPDTATGLITKITDTASREFNFAYDPISKLCTGISIPDGRSVSFTYDSGGHKTLTGITDMMGYHGTYEYDEYGFLTSMTTAGKTNTFTYNDRPGYETEPIATRDRYLSSLTRPGGKKVSYEILEEGGNSQAH